MTVPAPGLRVLIIEDIAAWRERMISCLGSSAVDWAEDSSSALAKLGGEPWDAVVVDLELRGEPTGGYRVLDHLQSFREDARPAVIVSTSHPREQPRIKKEYGFVRAFIGKFTDDSYGHFVAAEIDGAVAVTRTAIAYRNLTSSTIVGDRRGPMQEVFDLILQCGSSNAPVLILGEEGTGKELVAQEIHRQSRRSREPFEGVNCAALPEALIESELFGHERGAFTGAVGRQRGKLERAGSGTLFLDEVADMAPAAQAKLLRVLEQMEFQRLGGQEKLRLKARIVSATNKNLDNEIAERRFRSDLLRRLNTIPIVVPPLRERKTDIPALAEHFCRQLGIAEGRPIVAIGADAIRLLTDYDWPGNVRELRNAIYRALVVGAGDEILPGHFSFLNERETHPAEADQSAVGRGRARDRLETAEAMRRIAEEATTIRKSEKPVISVEEMCLLIWCALHGVDGARRGRRGWSVDQRADLRAVLEWLQSATGATKSELAKRIGVTANKFRDYVAPEEANERTSHDQI